jgi:Flp pilus assembly protein TadD
VLYLTEHVRSAFFTVPVLDGAYYREAARALIGDASAAGLLTGFRPLLYPLFLSTFEVWSADWGLAAAIVVQHLLGIATTLLVADLGFRLFGRTSAGALAGVLYALAGPPLFFEGEILITSLFTFLGALQLHFVARALAREGPALGSWLGLGASLALALQARPNALVFALAWPLLVAWGGPHRLRLGRGVALAAAAALMATVGFAWWQAPLIGRFQLLPSSGGVNLYLGNKLGADGRIPRQDRAVTYGEAYRDSVEVFAEEEYLATLGPNPPADLDPASISSYWTRRTVDEIRADPAAWLGLMARKIWYLCWNREIPNNKTWAFTTSHESRLLAMMPVAWWLLFALAPLGAWAAWSGTQRRLLLWVLAFLAMHALAIVAFFVNARFRLPLWPAMAVLAGGGLLALLDAWRARRRSALGLTAAATAAAAVSLVNLLGVPPDSFARDFFFRSIARLEHGDLDGALADARASLELDPNDPAAHYQLGNVALAQGDATLALQGFAQAVAISPHEPRTWNGIGIALELLGRAGEAERAYRQALEAAPGYGPALANLCLAVLRRGEMASAADLLQRLEQARFQSLHERIARAAFARALGDEAAGADLLAQARAIDSELAEQLWTELSPGSPSASGSPSPDTSR